MRTCKFMQDVDQHTGEDLNAVVNRMLHFEKKSESLARNPDRPLDSSSIVRDEQGAARGMTRMTSPEKWEIKQLISAGVLENSDYPGIYLEVDHHFCTCIHFFKTP